MPKVTVYIRNEDIDEWKSIGAKTTFVHNALKAVKEGGLEALSLIVDDRTSVVQLGSELKHATQEEFRDSLKPKTIIAPKEVVEIARGLNLKKDRNGLCKIHGIPLDGRGRCLQKGCKYS